MRRDRLFVMLPGVLLLAAGTLSAQTSRALLGSGAEQQYLTFKRTFQKMVDDGELAVQVMRDSGAVDLMDCDTGHSFLGFETEGSSARTQQLADLAYEVVRLKKLVTKLGYPESVWRPLLLDIEENGKQGFDPIEGAHLRRLSAALNAYRQRSTPSLPETFVEGGCGEGEVGIRIATRPRGGRVRLIPEFFYSLCKVQKIDPDDPGRCDHWREPAEGALLDVSGDYVYHAVWPDGVQRNGRLSLTNLEHGQTVTISKP